MPNLGPPLISGTMNAAPAYTDMGLGLTDTLYLIGHADGLTINDPYQVTDIKQAMSDMGSNSNSPLLRAMLAAYYSGARDMWLVASAPMSQYVAYGSRTGDSFYQNYYSALAATYAMLSSYGPADIVLPVEANYYGTGSVDFLTQLYNFCGGITNLTGKVCFGLLGTQGTIVQADVNTMIADSRLTSFGENGRQNLVVVGEAVYNFGEISTPVTAPAVNSAVGVLSALSMQNGLTNALLPPVLNPTTIFTQSQISALCNVGLNPITQTSLGRRGQPFQTVLATDNTLGMAGTDFWSLLQIRIAAKIAKQINMLANRPMNSLTVGTFKQTVEQYMARLQSTGILRNYSLSISSPDIQTLSVSVGFKPFYGLRTIGITVNVGPGAGSNV